MAFMSVAIWAQATRLDKPHCRMQKARPAAPMPARKRPAAVLGACSRRLARAAGNAAACQRPRGPKRSPVTEISARARHKREALAAQTKVIVMGVGMGRSGTMSLAVNLQRQDGWRVTHEAGNTHSMEWRPSMRDRFTLREQTPARRQAIAKNVINDVVAFAAGGAVAGDISWTHLELAKELLVADTRVHVVAQFRDDISGWIKSVEGHGRAGLPATLFMRGHGITAADGPRSTRLRKLYKSCLADMRKLSRQFPGRCHVVLLSQLQTWADTFTKDHGGSAEYDCELGRNATGPANREQQRVFKR